MYRSHEMMGLGDGEQRLGVKRWGIEASIHVYVMATALYQE
jgi:hypothetical protein